MTKQCSKCSDFLPATTKYFHTQKSNKDNLRSWCKECSKKVDRNYHQKNKEKRNVQAKRYREQNPQKIVQLNKEYRERNGEELNESAKVYRSENKERISLYFKERYQNNKQQINKQRKRYYHRVQKHDTELRVTKNLRRRVHRVVSRRSRSSTTLELIGCSVERLMSHLEDQFQQDMTWDNYGKWHIDHIRPCASFDLTDEEQQKECFHYSNLQPLWAIDNIKKGKTYEA